MKYIYLFLIFFCVFFLNACKENSTDPGPGEDTENYFPNSNGNYYKYNVEYTDSNGTKTTSTRSSSYNGTQAVGPETYQVQYDTISIAGQAVTGISLFQKNGGEVIYFLDTTGFAASIPPQYQNLLPFIQFDTKMKLLSQLPFESGDNWEVFKLIYKNGPLEANIVEIKGYYEGKENVTLNLSSGAITREAAKIRYVFRVSLPTLPAQEYYGNLWLVSNIGVVKIQGNATLFGVFSGEGIDFADTSASVSQSLVQYNVK